MCICEWLYLYVYGGAFVVLLCHSLVQSCPHNVIHMSLPPFKPFKPFTPVLVNYVLRVSWGLWVVWLARPSHACTRLLSTFAVLIGAVMLAKLVFTSTCTVAQLSLLYLLLCSYTEQIFLAQSSLTGGKIIIVLVMIVWDETSLFNQCAVRP